MTAINLGTEREEIAAKKESGRSDGKKQKGKTEREFRGKTRAKRKKIKGRRSYGTKRERALG